MENNYNTKKRTTNALYRWLMFTSCAVLFLFGSGQTFAQSTLINPSGDGGFENSPTLPGNGWTIVAGANGSFFPGNSTVSNGSYSFSPNGSRMAYFSNNSGVNWQYGAGTAVAGASHLYKDITFPAGNPFNNLTFRYNVNGEGSNWDQLLVYLCPQTLTPAANSPSGTSTAPTWTGTGTPILLGTYQLLAAGNGAQAATVVINSTQAGNASSPSPMRLVFTWKNDGAGGAEPPIALDDISLVSLPCQPVAQPTALTLTSTTLGTISGSFTAAIGAPTGYLVVRYPRLSAPTAPSNGTTYTAGQTLGLGTVVQASSSTTFNATGLANGTQYDFYIYSYNTSTSCAPNSPFYRTLSPLVGVGTSATPSIPTCPTTFSPINGAVNQVLSTTLSWSGATGTPSIIGYSVYLSTDQSLVSSLNNSALVSNGQSGTTFTPTNLAVSTTYYWTVIPISSFGRPSSCSVQSFTTRAPANITSTAFGGFWNDVNTWSTGVIPTPGDNVTIADGAIVTINATTNLNALASLTIGQGGSAKAVLQWTATAALTVYGDITIASNGIFLPYTQGLAGQTINIGGNFTNNGFCNLAISGTTLVFNGSVAPGGNASLQELSGTGSFTSNGTSALLQNLTIGTTGTVSINPLGTTTSVTLTNALNLNAGTLSTNSKLRIDNTMLGFNQAFNRQVASIHATTLGVGYAAAPIVFGPTGATVLPWPANGQALATATTTRYFYGDNVYQVSTGNTALLSTGVGPTFTTPSIQAAPSQTGTYNVMYLGKVGTIGQHYALGGITLTAGQMYFLGDNLYLCTVGGTSNNTNIPTCTSGTCAAGSATFMYLGSPAKASVVYDATNQRVRGVYLDNPGSGYLTNLGVPTVGIYPSTTALPTTTAAATAVFIQSIQGSATFTAQKSTQALISGGLTINSNANAPAFTGVGSMYVTTQGYGYTVAPTIGFPLPTNTINFVTNGGSGYTSAPSVTIAGGGGTGAAATAVVAQGKVVGVFITSAGTGYNFASTAGSPITFSFSGGGGTGASATFNQSLVPGATPVIDPVSGSVTGFTITNPGGGYLTAPTPTILTAGTSIVAMSVPVCRSPVYNLTYGFFAPATTNTFPTAGAEIPTNRKFNALTLGSTAAGAGGAGTNFAKVTFNSNFELFSATPISLPASTVTSASVLNLNGSTLTFANPAYNGVAGSTFGYVDNGTVLFNHQPVAGGSSTKTFPFEAPLQVGIGSTNASAFISTGPTLTTLSASITPAPSGSINGGAGAAVGARGYFLSSNGLFGNQPFLTMNWNVNDNFPTGTTPTSMYIGQATSLTGGASGWTARTTQSTAGTIPGTGTRTTVTNPVVVDLSNGQYFAWLSTTASSVSASAIGGAWTDPATWAGNVVPSINDDVVIPAGAIVYLDAAITVKNLTINGTLQWGASSFALTVINDITVGATGRFLAYNTAGAGQTINLGGNLTIDGFANLAVASTSLILNGSQQSGGRLTQTISGTTAALVGSSASNGIIRSITVNTTGSVIIDGGINQSLITGALSHLTGSLNTNGKLTIDNAAQVYGQSINRSVASVSVTNMGALYNAAPVVFGAAVTQWTSAGTQAANSFYYTSGNRVYLATTTGTLPASEPTHTGSALVGTLLYVGQLGTIGTPYSFSALTVGQYVNYNGNVYLVTGAGTPLSTNLPPTSTDPTVEYTNVAKFVYMGPAATVAVNYNATTRNVRSLTLTSPVSNYISAATLTVTFSNPAGVVAPLTAATAAAVQLQNIAGPANSAVSKSANASFSGGLNIQSSHSIGAAFTSAGGARYSAVPLVGFSGPANVNLVASSGSGYTTAPSITVNTTGSELISGTAMASTDFQINVFNGKVVSIYYTGGTSKIYRTLPSISISGGNGTGATIISDAAWRALWARATAVMSNGTNGSIVGFTIDQAGSGYDAVPTMAIQSTTSTPALAAAPSIAATAPTARPYYYSLSYVAPGLGTNATITESSEIPTNRKLNTLSINSTLTNTTLDAVTFTGNLELMASSAALTLSSGIANFGSNTLLYSHRSNVGNGTFGTGSTTTFVKGTIAMSSPGGQVTRTFPFSAPVQVNTGGTNTISTTVGGNSDITLITVTELGTPSGNYGVTGTRSYRVQTGGGVYGTLTNSATVGLSYNSLDLLTGNNADLFVGQAPAITGTWSARSISSGTGTLTVPGSRTTAAASTTATGTSGGTTITVASATNIAPGMFVFGTGIASGATVTSVSGTAITLSAANTAALTATPVTFRGINTDEYFAFLRPVPQITNVIQPVGGNCSPVAKTVTADISIPSPFIPALPTITGAAFNYTVNYTLNAATTITGTSGATTITVGSASGLVVGMTVTGTGIAAGARITAIAGTTITLSAANTAAVSGNGTFAAAVPMSLVSGSTYNATIPAAPTAGTLVSWNITATDSLVSTGVKFTTTFNGTSYADSIFSNTITLTPSPASFCGNGGTTTVSVAVSPADPSITYSWSGGATGTSSSVTANVTQTTVFTLVATKGGCSASRSVSVGVYPFPSATASVTPSSICIGSSATLNSGLSASNFSVSCITFSPIPQPSTGVVVLANAGVQTTTLTSGTLDDGFWQNIPIGFTFNYFGNLYTTVTIGTNGTLMFPPTASSTFTFGAFPSTSSPANTIAMWAADMDMRTVGTARYWVTGVAPNRIFVYDIQNCAGFSSGSFTGQVLLYETTGNVEVHLAQANAVGGAGTATVGLQNLGQNIGAAAPNCASGQANYYNNITASGTSAGAIPASAPLAWRFTPPNPYTVTFSPSNQISGVSSGTNVFTATALPTATGTTNYTITYTNQITGCSNASSPAVVPLVVSTNASLPVVTSPINICGAQTVTLSINNAATLGATDIVRWYNSATSTTPVATGTSFTTQINATTTFYVAIANSTCESTRVPLVVNITSPTQITVNSATVCATGIIPIAVTSNLSAYDTYIWSPTTNLYQDAAGTIQYAGQNLSTVYVRPSTQGQIIYTVNGYDFSTVCSNQATATVTVQPASALLSATATHICAGGPTTSTITVSAATPIAPNSVVWESSPDGSSWSNVSGNTSTTLTTPALTQTTYYRASLTNGTSTCTTTTPIIIDVVAPPTGSAAQTFCSTASPKVQDLVATGSGIKWYAAASGGTALASTTAITNGTTYYASQTVSGCESVLRFAVTATIGVIPAPTATSPQSFCSTGGATVSNLVATGSNIQWYAASTGGSPLAGATALTNGTTYYASQTVGGCESPSRVAVSVSLVAVTAAPTGSASQTFCSASNPTVSNLSATGTNIQWYDAATGGNLLSSSTALVDGAIYYASQTLGVCGESTSRLAVTVTIVTSPNEPTGSGTQSFCNGLTPRISDISVTGTSIKWYTAASGGTLITGNPLLVDGNHYYASQTVGGCESPSRLDVLVSITTTPAPTGATTQSFCSSLSPTVADLVATGTGIQWYSTATGGTALASTTALSTGTYYASQFDNGCESATRLAVAVSVTNVPNAPTGSGSQTFCSVNNPTVANLVATGTSILWYDAPIGGSLVSSSTLLVDGTHYYASQVDPNCGESTSRLDVLVSVVTTPGAPTGDATQTFCAASNPKVSNIVVTGTGIQWYAAATGGSPLASTTALVNGQTYYASQSVSGCEGSSRLAVTITIGTIAAPTGSNSQTFCSTSNPTLADVVLNEPGIVWYAAASGGSPLPSSTALVNGTTYYAAQSVLSCESPTRYAVQVFVQVPNAPTGSAAQTFCSASNPTVASLVATGTNILWYDAASGGNLLSSSTALVDGTTYYASQTWSVCGESTSRLAVTVTIVTTPAAPTGSATQDFCAIANPKVSSLTATGSGILWYSAATGGTALSSTTALVNGNTYYASQTVSGCESSDRFAVVVTISNPSAPTGTSPQTFCSTASPTVSNLVATGTGIQWYSTSTGGSPLSASTALTNGTTYYASQIVNGCESTARLAIVANVSSVTAAPTGASTQTFCSGSNPTLSNITVTGSNILWYDAATGGNLLASSTALVDGSTYYASQTQGGCGESPSRLAVTVVVNTSPSAPSATSPQSFCISSSPTVASLVATGSNISWFAAASGGTALLANVALTNGTSYFAAQTLNGCISTTRTQVDVVVGTVPSLTVTANQTVCNNTAVTLTATGLFTSFAWSPSTGLNTTSGASVIAQTTTGGTYTYTVTGTVSGTGCVATATTTVVVLPSAPAISATPSSICVSGTANLSISPAGAYGAGTIQWQIFSGGSFIDIVGSTGESYITDNLTSDRQYRAQIYDGAGGLCLTTSPLTMSVINPGTPTATGADRCTPGTLTLTGSVPSGSSLNWYASATGTVGVGSLGTAGTYTTPSLPSTTTYYIGSSIGTCEIRVPVIATINTPQVIQLTNPQVVCNNTTTAINILSNPANYTTYTWSTTPGGDLFQDANATLAYSGQNLTTVYVKRTVVGNRTYTVSATNSTTGCVSSASTTVYVQPGNITASAAQTQLCLSGSTQLSLNPAVGYAVGSIQWQSSTNGTSFSNIPLATSTTYQTLTQSTTRYYRAAVYDGSGNVCQITTPNLTISIVNPQVVSTVGSTVCGVQPTTISAVASPGATLNWYLDQTSATSIATGSPFVTPSITATTSYYVEATQSITSGTCPSGRTEVVINYTTPPALTVTPSQTICAGTTLMLQVTSNLSDYSSYVWAPTANLFTDAACTIAYTGGSATTLYYKRATDAQTTFSVTATNVGAGSCVNSALVTVRNQLLSAPTVSALPNPVCEGETITLSASAGVAGAATATIGTGTSTIGGSDGNPYRSGNGTGNQIHTQLLVTASELSAAGLSAGPINSLGFFTTSASSGTVINFSISMGHTAATALSATFQPVPGTVVFTASSFTPLASGLNVHNFSTPFVWNGTSNILIDVCQTNSVLGTATVLCSTPAFIANTHLAGSTTSCSAVSGVTNTLRPNMVFGGTAGVNNTSYFGWTWNPGSLTGSTVAVVPPIGATTYTATATDPATGCTATNSITVNVNPRPSAPTATNGSQTGAGVPTCSVSGSGGSFSWYLTPTGGTPIPGEIGTTLTSYTINSTTTFYVSESDGTCSSVRVPVTQTVISADPVTITASSTIACANNTITLTASQTGTTQNYTQFTWTSNGSAASGIATSLTGNPVTFTPTAAGTYVYTVSAYDPIAMVTQIATISIQVGVSPTVTVTPTSATLCQNSTVSVFANGLLNSGNSLTLNGTSAYVNVPNSASLDMTSNITLEAWIRPTSFATLAGIISKYQVSGQPSYFIREATASPFTGIGAGANTGFVTPTGILAANNWYYVAAVFKNAGAVDSVFIHVINPSAGTWTVYTGGTTSIASVTNALRIGSDFGGRFFAGNIDEVRIWNTAMSNANIIAWYNRPVTASHPAYSSLRAYYNFDNISGTTVPDLSGNGNDGTLTGGALANGATALLGGNALTYSWSPTSGVNSPSSALTTITPTTAGTVTYTVTVSSSTGCTATATTTLNVNPQATAPTVVTNPVLCGFGVPTTTVTSTGGTINWYLAPTGGAPVQSSGATSLTSYSISATTTFYVAEDDGTCESQRTPVTVTVTPADPITASASSATTCLGQSVVLSVSNSGTTQNYSYSWNGSAGSGLTTPQTGSSITVTPTAVGTYIYTVVGSDNGCSAASTVSVTVGAIPTIVSATAAPSTLCFGSTTTLSALNIIPAGTTFTEPFETAIPNALWSSNGGGVTWARTTSYFAVGTSSAQATYANSADGSLFMTSGVSLAGLNAPKLRFKHICATENNFDYGRIEYSINGGTTWIPFPATEYLGSGTLAPNVSPSIGFQASSYTAWSAFATSGSPFPAGPLTSSFQEETISLTSVNSASDFRIRFRLTSDPSVLYPGWLIDDVRITYDATSGNNSYTWQWSGGAPAGNIATVTPTATGTVVYTVTATDPATGCTATRTASVNVNPVPNTPTLVSNPSICGFGVPGATVTSTGGDLRWYLVASGGTPIQSSGATSLTSYSISTTTTFYVAEFDGTCESLRLPITVTVTPSDPITANASASTICLGSSVVLSTTQTGTTQNYSYTWNGTANGGLATPQTGSPITVTPTAAGTYTYTVVASDNGCVARSTVSVLVNPNPVITSVLANPSTVCEGGAVALSVTGTGTLTFTWNPGALTGTSLTVNPTASTTYTVTATNASTGCTSTATTSVAVITTAAAPVAIANPNPICVASAVNLSVQTVNPALAYTWQSSPDDINWTTIGTGAFFTSPIITSSTYFRVVAACGTNNIPSASVLVTVASPTITTAPASITRCGAGPITATVTGVGSFDWYFTGSSTPFATNTATVTVNVTASTTIFALAYIGSCTDPNGARSIPVTVTPAPAVTATAGSSTICAGTSTTLTAVSSNTGYSYTWTTNGNPVGTGASVSVTPAATTTYTVAALDGTTGTNANCAISTTVTVTVNPLPAAPTVTNSNPTICTPGGTSTLTVTNVPPPPSTNWTYTLASGTFAPLTPTGTVTVLATGGAAVTPQTVVSLDDGTWEGINLPFTFNYYGTSVSQISVSTNGFISMSGTLTGGAGCCSGQAMPSATTPNSVVALSWEDFVLSTSGTIDYFTNGVAPNRQFVVRYTAVPRFGGTGAPTTGQIILNEGSNRIDLQVASVTTASGDVTTMGIENQGGTVATVVSGRNASSPWTATNEAWLFTPVPPAPPVTYAWTPSSSLSSSTGTSVVASPTSTTTYTVTTTNTNTGCSNSTAVTVNYAPLSVSITASGPTTFCQGGSVVLDAGSGYTSYSWSNGTSVVSTSQTFTASPSATTTYTVTVSNGVCTATASEVVTVSPLAPPVVTSSNGSTLCQGAQTVLSVQNPANYTNFSWSTSATTSSITVNTTGTYSVTVTAANGCTATSSVSITVNPVPTATISTTSVTVCDDGSNSPQSVLVTTSSSNTVQWDNLNSSSGPQYDVNYLDDEMQLFGSYVYTATVTNSFGCTATVSFEATLVTCNNNGVTLNSKLFIQGYYQNYGSSTPMDNFGSGGCLFINGISSNPNDADEVVISLMDATTFAPVESQTGTLHVDGTVSVNFATVTAGSSYWLKVNHRNSIETWSGAPVTLSAITTYDWTTSSSQAYNNNMTEMEPGIWAIYSGDIADASMGVGFQDGVVESTDYSEMENAAYVILTGYEVQDLSGDGVVESIDYSLMENNAYLIVSFQRP